MEVKTAWETFVEANNLGEKTHIFTADSCSSQSNINYKDKIEQIEQNILDIDYFINDHCRFNDEMLSALLEDNIKQLHERRLQKHKAMIKRAKKNAINNFIKSINKVIYTNKKETIILWKDGTKTTVTCQEGETFDKEKGLALCIIKHLCGDIGEFNNIFKAFDFDSEEHEIIPNIK